MVPATVPRAGTQGPGLSTNMASFPSHTHPSKEHGYPILSEEETGSGGNRSKGRPLATRRREEVPGDRKADS